MRRLLCRLRGHRWPEALQDSLLWDMDGIPWAWCQRCKRWGNDQWPWPNDMTYQERERKRHRD